MSNNQTTQYQPVRGTKDYEGGEAERFRFILETALCVVRMYGFTEIMTPIFENAQVFLRSLGDTSDVVSKEMYVFEDKGGDLLALRPEGTAGVVRAFLTNGLTQALPQKLFYSGPMFRYERPQKGRMRQFHQVGVEIMGASDPMADAEAVAVGAQVLQALGIADTITLHINTLGDGDSRHAYRAALVTYFEQHQANLSEESRLRLKRNPLRILDSKDEGDRFIIQKGPLRDEFLTPQARGFFDEVLGALRHIGIAYEVDPYLVRGLDYYSHTAFEFVSSALGAQSTVLAGGRYEGLVEAMGGPDTPCVGWGGGIERMMLLMKNPQPQERPLAVIPVSEAEKLSAFAIVQELRAGGVTVLFDYQGNVGKRMKRAAKHNAYAAWLMGEDEVKLQSVTWKDLDTGQQEQMPIKQAMSRVMKGAV